MNKCPCRLSCCTAPNVLPKICKDGNENLNCIECLTCKDICFCLDLDSIFNNQLNKERINKMSRIKYLRVRKNENPVGCIAFTKDRETGVVNYAVSAVNPHDTFVRSFARKIAIGRLAKKPIVVKGALGEHPLVEVMRDIEVNSPSEQARRVASEWLALGASRNQVLVIGEHAVTCA